jgi:hypothetical protein
MFTGEPLAMDARVLTADVLMPDRAPTQTDIASMADALGDNTRLLYLVAGGGLASTSLSALVMMFGSLHPPPR